MPEYSSFPSFYDPSSVRAIVTPSAFARQNLFFLQEAGHIRLRSVLMHAACRILKANLNYSRFYFL